MLISFGFGQNEKVSRVFGFDWKERSPNQKKSEQFRIFFFLPENKHVFILRTFFRSFRRSIMKLLLYRFLWLTFFFLAFFYSAFAQKINLKWKIWFRLIHFWWFKELTKFCLDYNKKRSENCEYNEKKQ